MSILFVKDFYVLYKNKGKIELMYHFFQKKIVKKQINHIFKYCILIKMYALVYFDINFFFFFQWNVSASGFVKSVYLDAILICTKKKDKIKKREKKEKERKKNLLRYR